MSAIPASFMFSVPSAIAWPDDQFIQAARAVVGKYHTLVVREGHGASVRRGVYTSLPSVDFMADVVRVGKAGLIRPYWRIFEHFILGGCDWRPIAQAEGLDKLDFLCTLRTIEAALGKAFTKHGIYPVKGYFTVGNGRIN